MLPLQNRNIISTDSLPIPEDGTVYKLPDGQIAGAANIIYVHMKNKQVGSAQQLVRIPNVSKKFSLTKVVCTTPLKPKDIIRIKGYTYTYTSIKFIEYFGWVGHDTAEKPEKIHDEAYRVIAAVAAGPQDPTNPIYEQLCLEHIPGE